VAGIRAVLVVAGGLAAAGAAPFAQTAGSAPTRQTPEAGAISWADEANWPDFTTGSWALPPGPPNTPPEDPRNQAGPFGPNSPVKAPANAALAARLKAAAKLNAAGGSGLSSCEPMGVIHDPGTIFYFARNRIIISGMGAASNIWRVVYLDRTSHGDPEPSYFGDSIGHWEGKTLVIDTVAIRAEAQLTAGVPLDSTNTHMIERYRLTGPNSLELTKTVTNPDLFTKPWVATMTLTRKLGDQFIESYCWRDRDANSGVEPLDLTPP